MEIRFIPHNLINTTMWDSCIETSINGCIFAYSWYLNYACVEWNALIASDYKYIMPLPVVKKGGLKIIENPPFIEYLGIFSAFTLNPEIKEAFFAAIPKEYKYIHLLMNKYSINKNLENHTEFQWTRALEIDLISNYNLTRKKYSLELIEKLNYNKSFNFVSGIQLIDLLQLYNKNSSFASIQLKNDHLSRLRKICMHALRESSADIVGAYDNRNNLWAAILFVSSHNKAHPVFYVHIKNAENMFFYEMLLDFFIRKHSEKNLNLCIFENSRNNLILNNFGGFHSQYPLWIKKKLPFYLRFLKAFQ